MTRTWAVSVAIRDVVSGVLVLTDIIRRSTDSLDVYFVSCEEITDNEAIYVFHAVTEKLPSAKELLQAMKEFTNVYEVNVTRADWRWKDTKFHWYNGGVTAYSDGSVYHCDTWDMCYMKASLMSVVYVPTHTRGWLSWRRKKAFGDAQFAGRDNSTDGYFPLKATNIDDAIAEVEEMYGKTLDRMIEEAEASITKLRNLKANFLNFRGDKIEEN